MKFFLDTANIDEIKEAAALGVLDGVTTNPTLVARENRPFRTLIEEICTIVQGPVNAEVVSTETDAMVEEARGLAEIHPNISVKIPMIREGIKAVRVLSQEGIKTNVTLAFSSPQALIAAKAGAAFVSPFVGRLDDAGHAGMEVVREIAAMYQNYGFNTEVIVASVRNPLHVVEAALAGAHIATVPFKVLDLLFKHPLTDAGLKKFLQDWEKVPQK